MLYLFIILFLIIFIFYIINKNFKKKILYIYKNDKEFKKYLGNINANNIIKLLDSKNKNDNIKFKTTVINFQDSHNFWKIYLYNNLFGHKVSYDKNIEFLLENSLPIPSYESLNNKTVFIKGNIREGGRYPDIIIDKFDYERALNFLTNKLNLTENTSDYISKIVSHVKKIFNTKDISENYKVESNIIDSLIFSVKDNFKIFTKSENCLKYLKPSYNSLTNITALPYFIGDCREHGILVTFLCNVYKTKICKTGIDCNNNFRVIYTKLYYIDDIKKKIIYIQDHVFCIMIKNNKIWVIDPLYSSDTLSSYIKCNKNSIIFINHDQYQNYIKEDDFISNVFKNKIPIINCGYIYINNISVSKVIGIPIIWSNKLEFIDNNNILINKNSYDNLLLYNKLIHYDEYNTKWNSFNEWCPS